MKIIYTDMVGDLFHSGHINILKESKKLGDILIVGVHSDKDVENYKRKPIINMQNRIIVIEACKYVDKIIPNSPLIITNEFVKKYNINIITHAFIDEKNQNNQSSFTEEIKDKLVILPYTKNISTTDIILKIKNS